MMFLIYTHKLKKLTFILLKTIKDGLIFKIMEITAKELQEKINNGEKLIVDFYGTWCGPCKIMKPAFEKVANENTTDIQMYMMDIDENKDFVLSLGIRSIPTIKTFNKNELVETKVGVLNEGQIKDLVENLLLN
jgi:thioredoxin